MCGPICVCACVLLFGYASVCSTTYEAPFKTKCHQCFRYLYPTSDMQYPTSARARARARVGISDVRYRYRTSDIYFGRPI